MTVPRKKVGSTVEETVDPTTGATSIVVAKPTGASAVTDVYVLTISLYESSAVDYGAPSGIPSGFAQIDSVLASSAGGQRTRSHVYARRWTGTEGSSFTISGLDTQWDYRTATCHIDENVKDTASILDALDGTPNVNTATASVSTITLPAVTTAVANSGATAYVATYTNPIAGDPSGWRTPPIVQADDNGGFYVEAWQKDMVTPGSTGSATVALNSEMAATAIVWAWLEADSATAPDAPTSVTSDAKVGRVVVGWTAPASDGGSPITSYDVDWALASAPTSWLGPVSAGNVLSFEKTGLTNGTAYVFRVRAVNAIGAGSWSSTSAAATPFAQSGLLMAPGGTAIRTPSGGTIRVPGT